MSRLNAAIESHDLWCAIHRINIHDDLDAEVALLTDEQRAEFVVILRRQEAHAPAPQ